MGIDNTIRNLFSDVNGLLWRASEIKQYETYYAEEEIYLVKNTKTSVVSLVTAKSPMEAVKKVCTARGDEDDKSSKQTECLVVPYEVLECSYDLAIRALEKQKPKKPIIKDWYPAYCPNCNAELSEIIGDGYYKHWTNFKFCDCGQRLDWRVT